MHGNFLREVLVVLPFVKIVADEYLGDRLDFWSIAPTGDWSKDNAIGRSYAVETLKFIRQTGAYNIMGEIRRSVRASKISNTGTEVGFLQALTEAAVKGRP